MSPPDGISPMTTASHSGKSYLSLGTLMAIAIITVSLFCFFCVFLPRAGRRTATCLSTMFSYFYRSITTTTATTTSAATSPYSVRPNREVPASLPIFRYSTIGEDRPFDCSVCLTEFKDGERGRFLPRCLHRFHADCIDMWLLSHSTCPLCRSVVRDEIPEPPI